MNDRKLVPVERSEGSLSRMDVAYVTNEGEAAEKGVGVLSVLLRRWRLVVLAAVVVWAVGLPSVWLFVKPKYTATSAIEIAPVIPFIAFEQESNPIPFYSNYVNTQAALIMSPNILYSVLEDPNVRDLDIWRQADDRMTFLRENLVPRARRDSQLLMVTMTGNDPDAISKIVNAAVDAYMAAHGGKELTDAETKIGQLTVESDRVLSSLEELNRRAYEMAKEFGSTDISMREELLLARLQLYQENLSSIESSLIVHRAQILARESKTSPDVTPTDLVKLRSEFVANDPVVAAFTGAVAEMLKQAALESVGRKADSPDMEKQKRRLEVMQGKLKESKEKAQAEFDAMMEKELARQQDASLEEIKSRIMLLEEQKSHLEKLCDDTNKEVLALGTKGLDIAKIQEDIALKKDLYQTLRQRMEILRVERPRTTARVRVAYKADVPYAPSVDKRRKYSIVLAMGGLLFGAALAIFLQQLDTRVERPSDVETELDLRLLGTIPRFEDLDRDRIKPRHFLDDCRAIRVNLMLSEGIVGGRITVVASPQGRDGKTMLAINLATSIALTGKKVLLVDGDLRKPDIARYLKLDNSKGLNNVLADQCSLEEAVKTTRVATLFILPSNRNVRRKSDLLSSGDLSSLVEQFRARYDEIIIDTPATLAMPDARIWSTLADGVMLVARSAKTGTADMLETKDRFEKAGANILGVVLTGVHMRDSYEKYGHRYVKGYVDEPLTQDEWDAAKVFLLSRAGDEDEEEEQDEQNEQGEDSDVQPGATG